MGGVALRTGQRVLQPRPVPYLAQVLLWLWRRRPHGLHWLLPCLQPRLHWLLQPRLHWLLLPRLHWLLHLHLKRVRHPIVAKQLLSWNESHDPTIDRVHAELFRLQVFWERRSTARPTDMAGPLHVLPLGSPLEIIEGLLPLLPRFESPPHLVQTVSCLGPQLVVAPSSSRTLVGEVPPHHLETVQGVEEGTPLLVSGILIIGGHIAGGDDGTPPQLAEQMRQGPEHCGPCLAVGTACFLYGQGLSAEAAIWQRGEPAEREERTAARRG